MEISAELVQKLREKTGLGMMLCKKALIESNGDMEKAIENLRKQGEATAAKRAGKKAKEGKVSIILDDCCGILYEVNSETDFVARNPEFSSFVDELGYLLLKHKPSSLESAKQLCSPAWNGMTADAKLKELIAKIGENLSFSHYYIECYEKTSERIFSYIHGAGKIGVMVKLACSRADKLDSEELSTLGKDLSMQVAAASPTLALAPTRDTIPQNILAKEREIYTSQAQNTGKPPQVIEKIVAGKLEKFFKDVVLVEQPYIKNPEISVATKIAEVEKTLDAKITVINFIRLERGLDEV